MTVYLSAEGVIRLEGQCPHEDSETLLQHLAGRPGAAVDWRACESAHTAVIQVLLATKPKLIGLPAGAALARWAAPALT